MTTLVFDGLTLNCWQENEYDYDIPSKTTTLLSGNKFISKGSVITKFPISFNCYMTNAATEEPAIVAKCLTYGTLVINGVSYTNCTILKFSKIKEVREGTGKKKFYIEFDQVDYHS
jgi:hypothetical protein